jgi:hypothetical protein
MWKCHLDAFLWPFLFSSWFTNSLCDHHLQIWFLKLVYMVWILQCAIGEWCVLNLWCNFSLTLVMVFWSIKLNHCEAYVACFCRHFDHGILLGVLVDAIPWICKYVENFLAIKKCWEMVDCIAWKGDVVVELCKVIFCLMEST